MKRPRRLALYSALFVLGARVASGGATEKVAEGVFISKGAQRTYAWYGAPSDQPRPLVVVLHGSGGSAREMVQCWRDLARREGFLVAGADAADKDGWAPPQDDPVLLRDLVEAMRPHQLDDRRVYLFGYSAGAVFALYMGPMESEYFAAVATHAGAFTGEADLGFFSSVRRNIPMMIGAGTKDGLFPQSVVLATIKRFEFWGFPVTPAFVPGGEHSYRFYGEINERAWQFFRKHSLDRDPVFVPVSFDARKP